MRCDIRTTSLRFMEKNAPLFMRAAAACYCTEGPLKLRLRATAAAGLTPESSAASEGMLACSTLSVFFTYVASTKGDTDTQSSWWPKKTKQNKKKRNKSSCVSNTHTDTHLSRE